MTEVIDFDKFIEETEALDKADKEKKIAQKQAIQDNIKVMKDSQSTVDKLFGYAKDALTSVDAWAIGGSALGGILGSITAVATATTMPAIIAGGLAGIALHRLLSNFFPSMKATLGDYIRGSLEVMTASLWRTKQSLEWLTNGIRAGIRGVKNFSKPTADELKKNFAALIKRTEATGELAGLSNETLEAISAGFEDGMSFKDFFNHLTSIIKNNEKKIEDDRVQNNQEIMRRLNQGIKLFNIQRAMSNAETAGNNAEVARLRAQQQAIKSEILKDDAEAKQALNQDKVDKSKDNLGASKAINANKIQQSDLKTTQEENKAKTSDLKTEEQENKTKQSYFKTEQEENKAKQSYLKTEEQENRTKTSEYKAQGAELDVDNKNIRNQISQGNLDTSGAINDYKVQGAKDKFDASKAINESNVQRAQNNLETNEDVNRIRRAQGLLRLLRTFNTKDSREAVKEIADPDTLEDLQSQVIEEINKLTSTNSDFNDPEVQDHLYEVFDNVINNDADIPEDMFNGASEEGIKPALIRNAHAYRLKQSGQDTIMNKALNEFIDPIYLLEELQNVKGFDNYIEMARKEIKRAPYDSTYQELLSSVAGHPDPAFKRAMERVVGLVLKRIAPEAEDSINYRFLAEKTTNLLDKPNNIATEPDGTMTEPNSIATEPNSTMTVDKLADAAKAGAKASKLPKAGRNLSILGAGLVALYSNFTEAQEKAKEDLSKNPRRYTDEEIQAFRDALLGKPRDANNKQKNDANNNDILANLYSTLAEAQGKTEDLTGSTKYSDEDIQAFYNAVRERDPVEVIVGSNNIKKADEMRKQGVPEEEIWRYFQ